MHPMKYCDAPGCQEEATGFSTFCAHHKQVEVFAMALEMYSERLARDLAEHWREQQEDVEEKL